MDGFDAFSEFKCYLRFLIERGAFEIRVAESQHDLRQVFQLRSLVFFSAPDSLEFDEYDHESDHLMVNVKGSDGSVQLAATYRLRLSERTDRFYNQSEFRIEKFLLLPGKKLEMSRACVHPDYRSGSAMVLLWKGLAEYIRLSEVDYLFGCTSVWQRSAPEISKLYSILSKEGLWLDSYGVSPLPAFLLEGFERSDSTVAEVDAEAIKRSWIPPLMASYLKAGAKLEGVPGYDKDFQSTDVFTVLEIKRLDSSYQKKFLGSY